MASIADLVEDVAQGSGVDRHLHREALALADRGHVRLVKSGPLGVTAEVSGGEPATVTLRARGGALSVSLNGRTCQGWTVATLAAAIETWRRSPKRKSFTAFWRGKSRRAR